MNLGFAPKKDENYYPQVFLRERKHMEKKNVIAHITDDLEDFF